MASQPPARVNQAALSQIPSNPFYSLQSGYNVAIYIFKNILGLDPSVIINLSIFLAAGSTIARYLSSYLSHYARQYIITSVLIQEEDVILYYDLMRYMTEKHLKGKIFHSVKASTVSRVALLRSEDDEQTTAPPKFDANMDDFINYRTERQRSKISYQPYTISHVFYHARNIFRFTHGLRSTRTSPALGMRVTGELTIECLGRSLKPIEKLLNDAQTYSLARSAYSTNICRANGQNWMMIGRRPSRDINTVILDKTKKQALLRDINEYLHPATKKWYGSHGVPYRRGYLFSGPPGTGKTSLTAALAGVFGLDIYVLSLLDPHINEDALIRLFSSVPARSIVLLEDIDAAGITSKRRKKPMPTEKPPRPHAPPPAFIFPPGVTVPPPIMPPQPAPHPTTKVGISLSGLLNAIDGVSSSEGHVLIMTTNFPEELDKALVRPGRVDMHVHFELPHRPETIEMFMNMYKDLKETETLNHSSKPQQGTSSGHGGYMNGSISPEPKSLEQDKKTEANGTLYKKDSIPSAKELDELAEKFADQVPEGKLSLAAIQEHLLKHKKDPRGAVEVAPAWVVEALKEEAEKDEERAAEDAKNNPMQQGAKGTNWVR